MSGKTLRAYVALTKPKVTLLNLFVGVTCFVLAEMPSVNWLSLAAFSALGYLTVGGCGVLNSYLDRDIDQLMTRTSRRPIPSGKIKPTKALAYGLILTSVGLAATYFAFGALTALLVSLGIVSYVLIYTLTLKRVTRWNVAIGAIAGPFAALSGWTATGNSLSLIPLFIGLLDFVWTPSHLWGLAMRRVKEYASASVPMLPVISGMRRASELVFFFNLSTFGLSLLFPAFGIAGITFLVVAAVAGLKLVSESFKLLKTPSGAQASRVFLTSAPYLAVIMAALIIDRMAFLSLPAFALWAFGV